VWQLFALALLLLQAGLILFTGAAETAAGTVRMVTVLAAPPLPAVPVRIVDDGHLDLLNTWSLLSGGSDPGPWG
jgi:hypothetical protein